MIGQDNNKKSLLHNLLVARGNEGHRAAVKYRYEVNNLKLHHIYRLF